MRLLAQTMKTDELYLTIDRSDTCQSGHLFNVNLQTIYPSVILTKINVLRPRLNYDVLASESSI